MINFYEKMPEDMLDKAKNPNESKHQIKIPFRLAVSAPSGSGKTNFILNLISLFSEGEGTFNDITICTRNADEPLYNYLKKICPKIVVKEGLSSLPKLDAMNKKLNHLVVIDDLLFEKDQTHIINYYIRCRKLNCSIAYLSQSYFDIPSLIRKNCSILVFLKLGGKREVKDILRQFSLSCSIEQLLNMYEYATQKKFGSLFIDIEETNPEKKFRNGLINEDGRVEFLKPSEFGEDED